MKTTEAGMYRVNDPAAPKLVVGRFTLLWQSDANGGTLWVQDGEDEGAALCASEFCMGLGSANLWTVLARATEAYVAKFCEDRF